MATRKPAIVVEMEGVSITPAELEAKVKAKAGTVQTIYLNTKEATAYAVNKAGETVTVPLKDDQPQEG